MRVIFDRFGTDIPIVKKGENHFISPDYVVDEMYELAGEITEIYKKNMRTIFYRRRKCQRHQRSIELKNQYFFSIASSSIFIPSLIDTKSSFFSPVALRILELSIFRLNNLSYFNIHGSSEVPC